MKRFCIVVLILVSFSWFSCLETFEFEIEEQDRLIVVDGELTTADSDHLIKISQTAEFGNRFPDPVSGAKVEIINGRGERGSCREIEAGQYLLTANDFKGEIGESYHLEILLPDGSQIVSDPAVMPTATKADSASHQFEDQYVQARSGNLFFQKVVNVYVDASFPENRGSNPIFLRWETDELYIFPEIPCGPLDPLYTCYVSLAGARQEVVLFSSENFEGGILPRQRVYTKVSLPRSEYVSRHYYNVYQRSVTEEAYEYWTKVQKLTNQTGTIFDIPPAALRGNLSYIDSDDFVLGYFELAVVDTARTFTFPHEYRREVDPTPHCSAINRTFSQECCNCAVLENSTFTRPDWIQ